ncbi:unnamed protein product [Closterium sp. NIES-53]
MAKWIHLEANSTTQEFKPYNGRGGLYIGKAVLKNNVFVLDFVPYQGTADSEAIVNFTTWSHPPDLDSDFSPGGFCNNIGSSKIISSSNNIGRSRSDNNSTSTNRQLFINTDYRSTADSHSTRHPQKC